MRLLTKLRDALAELEQASAGMIGGRVGSASEVEAARGAALRAAHAAIVAAVEAGAAEAKAARGAIPHWARGLLDASLLARLESVAAQAAPAPRPASIEVETLGRLAWDDALQSYTRVGPLSVGGASATLSLQAAGPEDVHEVLRAHAWLPSRLEAVVEAAKRFAAEASLQIHRDGYADPGDAPLSAEAFRARLTLVHLDLARDEATLDFDDGDLFWGHRVVVVCGSDGEPRAQSIAG